MATPTKRINLIPYFDGVNTIVDAHLALPQEMYHIENGRSITIGSIEKREGTRRLGNTITATANYGLFYFPNSTETNSGFYRISTVSGTTTVYYINTSSTWVALTSGGTDLAAKKMSTTRAENCLFMTNGSDVNRYIDATGTTVVTSSTSTGHLYLSPIAYKVNYYKDRLYLGDYYIGSTRYKNSVMMSSNPLGIVALVDGDHAQPMTSLKVTDIKYIYSSDSLDIYRGGTKIGTVTVTGKNAATNTLTISNFTTDLQSADEVWVANTYGGTRIFRWADNPKTGEDVKQYDTFKVSGGLNDHLTMMANVGTYQLFGNTSNLSIWNGSALQSLDLGIGCSSDNGYVTSLGTLWFIHYTGIYKTEGGTPQLISAKVQRYIDGATKAGLEAAAAGKKGTSVFFAIGDVTLYHPDGSTEKTLSDVVLEYDIRQQNWYVHTGITATQFATYVHSTNADRLVFSGTDTNCPVYEFLRDDVDDAVTRNLEIPFRVDTNDITLSKKFETIAQPQKLICEMSRGSGVKFFVSLDGGKFYELDGEAIKGCTIIKVTNRDEDKDQPPRCRRIKVSIRDASKKRCKINRLALDFIETEDFEEQKIETYEQ